MAVAGTGLIFQVVATRNDQQGIPSPGRIGRYRRLQLHIHCFGEGSPTIILDALGSGSSASWGLVQPEIAQSTRVCSYDQAGAGWSDRGPTPRDVKQQVRELHALLAGAQSTGHLCWSVTHTEAGLPESMPRRIRARWLEWCWSIPARWVTIHFPRQYHKELAAEERLIIVARWLAPFGVVRLFRPRTEYYDLPAQQAAASDSFAVTTRFWQTIGRPTSGDRSNACARTRSQVWALSR